MYENTSSISPSNISATTEESENATAKDCPVEIDTRAEKTLKVTAYAAILLVSLVGNALVILVFGKNKPLRRSINYFVVNMAASDLFTPLTIMPVTIAEILSGSEAFLVDSPLPLGNILCKLCYFLADVSVVVSIQSLLLISADRLVAVVFPLMIRVISSKVRLICILSTWIVAMSIHAPYLYFFKLKPEGNSYTCQLHWGSGHDETHPNFTTAIFITFFVVPVCILVVLYSIIAWTLKRRHSERKRMSTCSESRAAQNNTQIIRLSVAILTAFVFCIGPLFVFTFIRIFVWNWREPPVCAFRTVIPFIAHFALHSWGAINPCICFAFSQNYHSALKQLLTCRSPPLTSTLRMTTYSNISRKHTRSSRSSSDHIALRVIEDQEEKQGEEEEQGPEQGREQQKERDEERQPEQGPEEEKLLN